MEEKRAISNSVFETLKEKILSGLYAPDEKLPSEKRLCETFGVSRVTIRAALDRLRGMGLIYSQRGGGTFVRNHADFTANAVSALLPFSMQKKQMRLDMFEFRRVFEVESVGLAAMRSDEEMVRCMREAALRMRQAESLDEIARWDLEFHQLIAQATRNQAFSRVFEALKDVYFSLFRENVSAMGAEGAEDHEQLCSLIEIRDVAEAKKCMAEHINRAIRQTEACIREKACQAQDAGKN